MSTHEVEVRDVDVSDLDSEPTAPIDAEFVTEDALRRARLLNLIRAWLHEQSPKTRLSYAETMGVPVSIETGAPRDTSQVRNGVTWLQWCASEGVDPLEATRHDVIAWIDELHEVRHPKTGKLLAKGTKAHMLRVLSSFYRWATEEGHTSISPVQVNRKKLGLATHKDKSRTRSLDRTEVAALQHAADHDRITAQRLRSAAIVATLFAIGMRVSELTGLTTADMAVMQGKRVLWLRLKRDRQHVVELPDYAATRIDRYLAYREDLEQRPALRGDVGGAPRPLFATANGKPVQRSEVLRLLKRLAKQAGIEDPDKIHPHVARHTWITTAREEGIDPKAIQDHVGHQNEETTARYGNHPIGVKAGIATRVAAAYENVDKKEEA